MGPFAPIHLIVLVMVLAIFIWPASRILKRVGLSPWMALLFAVPLVNIIFLWIFAHMRWPRDDVANAL